MGFPRSGGLATSIAAGATALGNLTVTGDLTMGSGAQVFIDSGTLTDPGLAFGADVDTGLYYASTSMRHGFGGAPQVIYNGSTIVPQVALVTDNLFAVRPTVTITASTTQTQGQGALLAGRNYYEISVCANTNDTVTLPAPTVSQFVFVVNNGAQTLQIFPSASANLGLGTNTPTTIVAGARACFIGRTTLIWDRLF